MKIFILTLLGLIPLVELNFSDDDLYELEELLHNEYHRHHKHRPNKQYIHNQVGDNEYSSLYESEELYPLHRKVLDYNDDTNEKSEIHNERDRVLPKTMNEKELSDPSLCVNEYDIRTGRLVKVKQLRYGARMLRYTIDKKSFSSAFDIKNNCMLHCCAEKSCDLVMLDEIPSHKGYRCYLFACNGGCTLASHPNYTVMTPRKDSKLYTESTMKKIDTKSTTTSIISNMNVSSKALLLHEVTVILLLVFGLMLTVALFVLIHYYCRKSGKRGRKLKNYAVDADYLINGLYL